MLPASVCKNLTRFVVFLAVFAGLAVSAPVAGAKTPYHVSYLWHHDLESVRHYRRDVGAVLGQNVAGNLQIFSRGDLFGLIYVRRGGSAGATRTAKVHTKLLRRAGLHVAAPMREGSWSATGPGDRSNKRPVALKQIISQIEANRHAKVHDLESVVADYIKRLRRRGRLSADERTGWSVYDFTTGKKLVTINEDIQFQAASLIKPFIAAAFFHRVNKGDFIYGPASRNHMHRMIHWSDNRSTNWVMRQAGGPRAVHRILHDHYPTIFRDTKIVEYIPAGGKTYRNKASVHDYSRFLYALWKNKFPGASEIRRFMALPGPDRIFTGVDNIPEGSKVFNKTGSTARLCGDMGILTVEGPGGKIYPYIIIGLIEKRRRAGDYASWIRSRADIIRHVSSIVYKGITRHHDFGNEL